MAARLRSPMVEVIIVGGGPVGLYLAARLLQDGIGVRVLERRTARSAHSRAIGIHPPGLAVLGGVGVAPALVRSGLAIREGEARSGGGTVAVMDFARASPSHPFVLALPQTRTEELLEERVRSLDPDALVRGVVVSSLHQSGGRMHLDATRNGVPVGYDAALVVGADGARSTVRGVLGIPVRGREYPDSYLMGDFADSGADGSRAVLYLEPGGIVESFPLPGGRRRWVVHTDAPRSTACAAELAALVKERTGVDVDAAGNSMLSAFTVRARLARRMVAGPVVLVGDAAHEISPIGGQGMTLGWLDAAALAPLLVQTLAGRPTGALLADFERTRRRAAVRAARQSHLNMALGRPLSPPVLAARNAVLRRAFTGRRLNDAVARRFSMQ